MLIRQFTSMSKQSSNAQSMRHPDFPSLLIETESQSVHWSPLVTSLETGSLLSPVVSSVATVLPQDPGGRGL